MSACACMGPAGDCYCIRKAKGLPIAITQTYAHPDYWNFLTDAEKETINKIVTDGAFRMIFDKRESK